MKGIKIFACPTAEEFTQEICDYLKEDVAPAASIICAISFAVIGIRG